MRAQEQSGRTGGEGGQQEQADAPFPGKAGAALWTQQPKKALPVQNRHRQNGTELNGHAERARLVPGEAEQIPGNDQVAGGRNGEELGKPLHSAQESQGVMARATKCTASS